MSNAWKIDETLDAWLTEELSDAECDKLLVELSAVDPEQERQNHRLVANVVITWACKQEVEAFQQQFLEAKKAAPVTKTSLLHFPVRKWLIGIAASLLLLFGVGIMYEYQQTSSRVIYHDLFELYEVQTDRASMASANITPLVTAFQKRNYTLVIAEFKQIASPDNRERFLTGFSYLQLEQPASAELEFRRIKWQNEQVNNGLYNDQADYYLALALLAQKKNEEARAILKQIRADAQHTYHEKISRWTMIRLNWLR